MPARSIFGASAGKVRRERSFRPKSKINLSASPGRLERKIKMRWGSLEAYLSRVRDFALACSF